MQYCIVQTFGKKKLINLQFQNKRCKIIYCDEELHNIIKILLSLKK